jgi:hypothetical protein
MLDYLHLPKQQNGNIDYFPGFSNTDGGSWVAWEKPKGTHMIRITCIGGGGGGGYGQNSTASSRTSGAGGGSGAITIVTIPAYILPDILYVSAGTGGNGGKVVFGSGTNSTNGSGSYVCVAQSTAAIYTVCIANGGGGGGSNGTTTAGSGGTVATIADMLLASYGIYNFLGGQSGGTASSSAATAITYPTTGLLLSGGVAGGGGISDSANATAPTQTVYNIFPSVTGGVAGTNGTDGQQGHSIYQPLLSCGGAGGGSSNTTGSGSGTGGSGAGGGFPGSGGGGSGCGSGTGGDRRGGNGGAGLIVIHSW